MAEQLNPFLCSKLDEALAELDDAQLGQVLRAVKFRLYPEASINKYGRLVCSCGHTGLPDLREDGYIVTHVHAHEWGDGEQNITDTAIIATGWDGDSDDLSEEGDLLLLECQSCFRLYRVPDSIEVEWV